MSAWSANRGVTVVSTPLGDIERSRVIVQQINSFRVTSARATWMRNRRDERTTSFAAL
jgi:hypothetical protein